MAQKRNQDEDITLLRVGEGPALREDEIDGWHRLRVACAATDQQESRDGGGDETPDRTRTAAALRTRNPGGRTLRWLARDAGGEAVGSAWLRLPDLEGARQSARFGISVHPEQRRRGIAATLFAAVRAEAVAAGRGSLGALAGADTDAEQALTAWGFTPGTRTLRLRLDVNGCDQEALRATVKAASEGYELARWPGVVPNDLAASYAQARNAMADVPGPGQEAVRAPWDEARVRAAAESSAAAGKTLLTVAALYLDEQGHEAVAGYSEVVLPGGTGPLARQNDTVVVRAHRGRGLGLWVKAAMLQWLLGAHPEVSRVVTDCAEGNVHMIAINEQLGFEPVGWRREFRLPLD